MKKIIVSLLVSIILLSACTSPKPDKTMPASTPEPMVEVTNTDIPTEETQPVQNNPDQGGFAWGESQYYLDGLIKEQQPVLVELENFNEYHVWLTVADNLSQFDGRLNLRFVNQESVILDKIYFHLYPNYQGAALDMFQVLINDVQADWAYLADNTILEINLPESLNPGETAFVTLDFTSSIPTVMGGNYGLFGYFNGVLVLDTFIPTLAVYDETGWHAKKPVPVGDLSYSDAAFYLVEVTAPEELILVTSGIELENKVEEGRQIALFSAGPARDFYLAGSSSFQKWQGQIGEVTVNSYTFPEFEDAGELALNFAETALSVFSTRYGNYPYTEFDVISSPMQALGIEYPGITGIALDLYRLDESANNKTYLESVIAHEVGHQWFYNLVGNDQVLEPWIDESVTQFVTGVYYEDTYGLPAAVQYRTSWDSRWKRVDRETIPIGMEAIDYFDNSYSPIIYGRGPYFLMELRDTMGRETFDIFMRTYVETYQWKIATTEGFQQLAEDTCACDLTALFEEWVYEE